MSRRNILEVSGEEDISMHISTIEPGVISSTEYGNMTCTFCDVNNSLSTENSGPFETEIKMTSLGYSALEVGFTLIGFAGILGNLSTIGVILSSKKLRKKLTNHFLINQSIIDILAGFFLVTNTLTRINNLPEHFDGILGE